MTTGGETCSGCGLVLPRHPGATHAYIGASPSCWALFGEVLAREYGRPDLMAVHRLTVDAYAAQHPGVPTRRSTQSVWIHLAGLHLTIGRGLSPDFARRAIGALTRKADGLVWLEPPELPGAVTVADVAARPEDHLVTVNRWARAVWDAWSVHHRSIAAVVDRVAAGL